MANKLGPREGPYPEGVVELLTSYPKVNGAVIALFRTFANSERFLKKGIPNLLDADSPLTLREREIVILRVTANRNCEYEWGVHVYAFSGVNGLTDDQIANTASINVNQSLWSYQECVLLDIADQLCSSGTISDATLIEFQKCWTVEQQLEIFALSGAYNTVSFVANAARLSCETFAPRFPADKRLQRHRPLQK